MKRYTTLLGLVWLATTFLPACAPPPEPEPEAAPEPVFDQAAEEAAVRKANEKYNAAWSAHDANVIVATRDESKESWDGTIKHGEDDLKMLEAGFAGPFKNIRGKLLKEIGVVFVTPEVAIYKGVYLYPTSGLFWPRLRILSCNRFWNLLLNRIGSVETSSICCYTLVEKVVALP